MNVSTKSRILLLTAFHKLNFFIKLEFQVEQFNQNKERFVRTIASLNHAEGLKPDLSLSVRLSDFSYIFVFKLQVAIFEIF